jgi:hypothetical protein
MVTRNRLAIASLLFAVIPPAVILFLALLQPNNAWDLPEPLVVTGIIAVVILCPLAAAFCGHAARRQIQGDNPGKGRGHVLAAIGLALGYLELACVALFLVATPIHTNRAGHYEASAVGSLRTINLAEHAYAEAHPTGGYTKALQDLAWKEGQPERDWSINQTLASGVKSHYKFIYIANPSKQSGVLDLYKVFADPTDHDMRHFFTDQTGIIRYSRGGPANESSAELK